MDTEHSSHPLMEAIQDYFSQPKEYKYTIRTGLGGFDLFDEVMEEKLTGKKRLYIGKKVLRILRIKKLQPRKSVRNIYYYLVNAK